MEEMKKMNNKDQKTVGQGGMIALLIVTVLYTLLAGLEVPEGVVFIPWLARVTQFVVGIVIAFVYLRIVNKYFADRRGIRVILAVLGALLIPFAGFYLHYFLALLFF